MRKICVVSSSRAEYGIMSRLIKKLDSDPEIDLRLLVTGTHLSKKFGKTVDEISVKIAEKIDIGIEGSPQSAMAKAVVKFCDAIEKIKPDILVLLGDRYEIMAVAIAAMLSKIPIAHIAGGDSSFGAFDEAARHSITKMSHLHFAGCEEHKRRIIQLGENPKYVFNVGELGAENSSKIPLMSKCDLEKSINFKFAKKNVMVTFHPETLSQTSSGKQFAELLGALEMLEETNIIITMPNSDPGNEDIMNMLSEFSKGRKNVLLVTSLGVQRYLSSLKFVDLVLGNSSSGIIEAPSFKIPTINIGERQAGRIRAVSVIDAKTKKSAILSAIRKAYSPKFKKSLKNMKNPYYKSGSASKIVSVLKNFNLDGLLKKKFYDLETDFRKVKKNDSK